MPRRTRPLPEPASASQRFARSRRPLRRPANGATARRSRRVAGTSVQPHDEPRCSESPRRPVHGASCRSACRQEARGERLILLVAKPDSGPGRGHPARGGRQGTASLGGDGASSRAPRCSAAHAAAARFLSNHRSARIASVPVRARSRSTKTWAVFTARCSIEQMPGRHFVRIRRAGIGACQAGANCCASLTVSAASASSVGTAGGVHAAVRLQAAGGSQDRAACFRVGQSAPRNRTDDPYREFESLLLRQSVRAQLSPLPCGRASKPNNHGPSRTNLRTTTPRLRRKIVSLRPCVTQTPGYVVLLPIW